MKAILIGSMLVVASCCEVTPDWPARAFHSAGENSQRSAAMPSHSVSLEPAVAPSVAKMAALPSRSLAVPSQISSRSPVRPLRKRTSIRKLPAVA